MKNWILNMALEQRLRMVVEHTCITSSGTLVATRVATRRQHVTYAR